MEAPEKEAEDPQVTVNVSQSAGHDFTNQPGTNQDLGLDPTQSHEQIQDQSQSRRDTDGWKLQQQWGLSLQPAFQDSNLSPALPLLTVNTEAENMFTEYSLFQHSDNEFSPLRPYPDISMASGRFQCPPEDDTAQSLECASLSQHPLAQESILSEEEQISCYSLSQHSLSPADKSSENQGTGENKKSLEPPDEPPDKPLREEAVKAEALFLKKDIPAEQHLELLQKDIETRSGSSAFSSSSQTSVKFTASSSKELESLRVFKLDSKEGSDRAEDQDETPLRHKQPGRDIYPDQPGTLPPGSCNITVGPRSSQPDDSSEALHRELLSEVERSRVREAESEKPQKKSPSPPAQFITPLPTETYRGEQSVPTSDLRGEPGVEPLSTAVVQGHREPDLWSSGNQTGIDGSYLGFLPQSQSTPGVFSAPPKSSVKRPPGQLSAIESDNSNQSDTGTPPQPAAVHHTGVSSESQEEAAEVQSLPTVNFKQKVDAWRANQGSGNMSLFDSLALQGFSGVSPKKRAYDAVSDTLNGILSQQVRSLNLPPGSYAANQDAAQRSSFAQAGSSVLWREEAAGSAPGEEENTGSAPGPSTSIFNRSQFHSSHSTVAVRSDNEQQTEGSANRESLTQSEVRHQPSASAHPSPLVTLDQFSDVSPDPDSTLSGSRDSHSSMVKQETSVGASSVVSLEVDNYAPYWKLRASTPPPQLKPQELNIEERIPLYLHNLGIDQSPSTILNPFAPRGPIREPEFSPTDLCTIKGSVGTSTRSSQPSEGSSPQKGEFSRSSIMSVDSSISVPISLDSLGPAASVPEQTGHTSPSGTEALQSNYLLEPSSQYDEDSYPSTVQTALRQQRGSSLTSSQNTIQPGDGFDSDLSSLPEARDVESPLGISHRIEEPSLVSSVALSEVHKLLPQAENMVSAGSSAAFSTSAAAPHTLSAEDILLSLRKKIDRLPDFSGTSSGTENLRSGPSSLWTRSSSDSMLTSEKLRERSVGQESRSLSAQPGHPSTQPSITTPTKEAYEQPQDGAVGRGAGPPFVLSQSAHRAEPEGCSAAPLDATVPPQPAVVKPPPAVDTQQLSATLTIEGSITEEEKLTPVEGPARSSDSSTPPHEDSDQAAMSDASSESSLAVRVAKLLQKETSATMMSITSSITDQEESRAREWLKLKISGQQCEPLELDKEDRMRIEEIKRELLLLNPIRSQESTDTESSAASSAKDPTQPAENFSVDHRGQQSLRAGVSSSSLQLPNAPRPDLEAQIRAIAAKEGVTLSRASHRAFTSITIATRRRSTSPSPSSSPTPPLSPTLEPLHLNELSTGAVSFSKDDLQLPETTTAPSLGQSSSLDSNLVNVAAAGQTRQETVGGQFEDVAPSPRDFIKHQDDNIPSVGKDDNLPVSQVTHSSRPESPSRPGHISYVHLTLSPKAVSHILPPAGHSRHLSTTAISPDEGVGLSSPPEWYDSRDPIREQPPERVDTSALFKISDLQGRSSPTSPFKPLTTLSSPRDVILTRPQHAESPAVPVLLPYKPHGSEELFYIPQTGFLSDTTVESSHPDSDDAVPPPFSRDILGNGEPTLDRGVSIRHTEGIYSKRRKTAGLNMQEPEHRGAPALAGCSSQMFVDRGQRSSSQVSVSTVPPSRNQEFLKTDRGTSPVQFTHHDQPEPSRESFQPVRVELQQHHLDSSSDASLSAAQQSHSTLDQLWGKFCSQWRQEESRLSAEREASLLERLERLSRLMRYMKDVNPPGTQRGPEEKTQRRWDDAVEKERKSKMRAGRPRGELPVPHQVRTQTPQSEETAPPVEVDSFSSITHSQSLRPADRDPSETMSTASGSVSTVDTSRMVRVFGADRVQILKSSSSIRKLYRTINEQKEGKNKEPPRVITLSETSDESAVAADSEPSTSTYILPSHRRTPATGKGVGLVSRGIQAGDVELVWNGTRRHTRDVGITFPPPRESETHLYISSSSSSAGSERGRGGRRSLAKTSSSQRRRKIYPKGISWYISADELRSEARKENRPDEGRSAWGRSTTWFEPYSRIKPWREPLRQRQVPEDRNRRHRTAHRGEYEAETRTKTAPSGGAPMSLQESLQRHRPEFIHQSRQRVERLMLQAEERRLQEFFGERQEVYGRHGDVGWLPRPAGTALRRRAVPRKEMIQRSKQIYETLPEVQRRRAEERRKAEYESYRLNARLYNKRITNRVLNRRTAWH